MSRYRTWENKVVPPFARRALVCLLILVDTQGLFCVFRPKKAVYKLTAKHTQVSLSQRAQKIVSRAYVLGLHPVRIRIDVQHAARVAQKEERQSVLFYRSAYIKSPMQLGGYVKKQTHPTAFLKSSA